ncbi:MAG: hypothetical protein ACRDPK_21005 [Carbonactinosporaceae bacterium]
MSQLSDRELGVQQAELLPAREALNIFNFGGENEADVDALNVGAGVNLDSPEAEAEAAAGQTIVVIQG